MVVGIALFSWDRKLGPVLDIKYPESFELSVDLTNKIYMTHAYKQDGDDQELIETNFNDQIIISYCDKSKVPVVGYEIFLVMMHEQERLKEHNIKEQLLEIAKSILDAPKSDRKSIFKENIDNFFKKTTKKKILLLGRAGTGKSSIKEVVFEGKIPGDLLMNPLAPTRGLSPAVYSWLDIQLGLFDTSGQVLDTLLEDDNKQYLAFENANTVIYLFDYVLWKENNELIMNDISRILEIIKQKSFDSNIVLFLHKIDLIPEKEREQKLKEIRQFVEEELHLTINFTSIYPEFIYNTYNAFYEILNTYSEESKALMGIINERIKDSTKTMLYVTNKNNSVVVQAMTSDFNYKLINHIHKMVAQLAQSFEDMKINNDIENLILSSKKDLVIIMTSLNISKYDLKNIICVSESLTAKKLIWMTAEIRALFNKYIYNL